jgi:hypothetical protein
MNEDQMPTDGTQQGAPSVPSDAEYQDAFASLHADHQKKQSMTPPQPAGDGIGKKVSDFFSSMVPDRNTIPKYSKAIARGVVNAGREAADTLNAVGDATGAVHSQSKDDPSFVEHWYNKPIFDSTPMTDGEVEGYLGKHDEGMAGFVENITQFTTGMVVAGEVLKPLKVLQGATALRGALAGGLADMTVLDPHQARLSNMVQDSRFSNVITGMLATEKDDSELTARLKAGVEGLVTGYTIDKFIGGIKALRALKAAKTPEEQQAAIDLMNVKHDPAVHGSAVVEPLEDGTAAVRNVGERRVSMRREADANIIPTNESLTSARKLESPEIDFFSKRMTYEEFQAKYPKLTTTKDEWDTEVARLAKERGVDGPAERVIFPTVAEAESHAASANQAELNSLQPKGRLSDEQIRQLTEHADALIARGLPTWVHPDFNFNYMASPVEVKATIQAISEKLPLATEVQTHAQTVALAEDMFDNMSGEQVVDALRRQNVSMADMPQRITAARTYLESHAQKVASLSKVADAMPTNGIAFDELKKAMTHLYDIHESVAGMSKSIGRALDAHKIVVGESAVDNADRAATEHLTTIAQKQALEDMSKAELLATARIIRMSEGNPKEILALMRGETTLSRARKNLTLTQKIVDGVNSYRMEAMLSGPRTAFVNAVSNAMAAAQMPIEMWWGGAMTGNKAMRDQGADQLVGLFLEARDALTAARKAWQTGINYLDESASVVNDGTAATDGFQAILKKAKVASRVLMTTDEFFKTLNYRSSVRAQSLRLAREEGITDAKQLALRLREDMQAAFTSEVKDANGNVIRRAGSAVNPKALQWARTATFQNPLEGGVGSTWQKMVQEHPGLRLITPFVRTPVNLFRYAWQRTPVLGAFQKQMRLDIQAGGERRALALAKQSMGMQPVHWRRSARAHEADYWWRTEGPATETQWLAAGNQPYSVKLPSGGWMSYQRGEPCVQRTRYRC